MYLYSCIRERGRTSPAHVARTPARGIRIVSTQGTIEVYESSHYPHVTYMHSHKPSRRLHYFPPGPQLPSQASGVTAPRPAPTWTAWWERHISVRGKSSESVQCAITGPCLRMCHRPSAQRTVPIRKICHVRNLPKVFMPCAELRHEPRTSWSQVRCSTSSTMMPPHPLFTEAIIAT